MSYLHLQRMESDYSASVETTRTPWGEEADISSAHHASAGDNHDDESLLINKDTNPQVLVTEQAGTPSPVSRDETTGVLHFIGKNPTSILTITVGTACATACFIFSYWLSKQRFTCPSWSIDCEVPSSLHFIVSNLGTFQGIISFIYGTSFTAMAYTVYMLGESALWPLLARGNFRLGDLDTYLAASRRSVPGFVLALSKFRTGSSITVLLLLGCVTIVLQAESILIGIVFTRHAVTTTYTSFYNTGGGTGVEFLQGNPPPPMPAAMTLASSLYSSWAYGLSAEPLPLLRDFVVDRTNLSSIGNATVSALRIQRDITCSGQNVSVLNATSYPTYNPDQNWVLELAADTINATSVSVRLQSGMSVWVDSHFEDSDSNSSNATLIFVVFGGQLEGGTVITPTPLMEGLNYNMTAMSCTVEVALLNDNMTIGNGGPTTALPPEISSLDMLSGPGAATCGGAGTCLATWLAVAVTRYGYSIWGAQPVWRLSVADESFEFQTEAGSNTILPVYFTSSNDAALAGNVWTEQILTNFIEVGAGAMAIAMSRQSYTGNTTVSSQILTSRLDTARTYILLVPLMLILLLLALMIAIVEWLNRSAKSQHVRLVRFSDIIQSTQTPEFKEAVESSRAAQQDVTAHLDAKKVRLNKSGTLGMASGSTMSKGTDAKDGYFELRVRYA